MIHFSILRTFTPERDKGDILLDFTDVRRWLFAVRRKATAVSDFKERYKYPERAVLAELVLSFANESDAAMFKLAWHDEATQLESDDRQRVGLWLNMHITPTGVARNQITAVVRKQVFLL